MRIPSPTIAPPQSVVPHTQVMAPAVFAPTSTGVGVQPSIDIGCILSTAAGCLFKCGLDVPCLLACAPGLAKCL
jgi:hypothetical protein